jgi:hypothetical protein
MIRMKVTMDTDNVGNPIVNAQTSIGNVTIYESENQPGRLVIDIDNDAVTQPIITINDEYIHGGPA